ncbi:MAG: hypothetical protein WCA30_03645 [Dermatophilaceae bacterium]
MVTGRRVELVRIVRRRDWPAVFGYVLFIGAMAGGYFFNLTFVQLGLVDLAGRVIGLAPNEVATQLSMLAALTLVTALGTGVLMHRRGWSARFLIKLRLLFGAVVVLTGLTAAIPLVDSTTALTGWIVLASVALGVGVPSMFGLTCDLVPTRDRGWVGAVITSAAFAPAVLLTTDWRIERFAEQLLWFMVAGAAGLGLLAFAPLPLTAALARQHESPRFGQGRFVPPGSSRSTWPGPAFVVALLLMFGVYFIDSLGFLRIIDTPVFMDSAWHSAEAEPLWFIAGAHVLAAVLAGVLYPAFGQHALFGWVFALFALAQLTYVVHALTVPELPSALGTPLLYAMAVSIYTVLNFAIWADFSTPATIARNTALGVGISGWLASFLSTSLSISWRGGGMELAEHLRAVAAISLALLAVTAALLFWPTDRRSTA